MTRQILVVKTTKKNDVVYTTLPGSKRAQAAAMRHWTPDGPAWEPDFPGLVQIREAFAAGDLIGAQALARTILAFVVDWGELELLDIAVLNNGLQHIADGRIQTGLERIACRILN